MKTRLLTLFVVLICSFAGEACAEKAAEADKKDTATNEAPAAKKGPAYPAEKRAPVDETLAAYERARVLFFNDTAEGIEAAAKEMAAHARKASEGAPDAAKPHLDGIAAAATQLEAAMKEGIEPARKSYGDVSKHVVALLVAFPPLTEGRYLFQCPMAPGYKKWVQTDDKLANPYMGQRMPSCGGKSDWAV